MFSLPFQLFYFFQGHHIYVFNHLKHIYIKTLFSSLVINIGFISKLSIFLQLYLFCFPSPGLNTSCASAIGTTCRWRRSSQSLTLGAKTRIIFGGRNKKCTEKYFKNWYLFMLACGVAIYVGVRVLVAILRKLMQLHMVEHDLEISFLRHCFISSF